MASFNLLLFILSAGITSEFVLVLGRELSQQVEDITFIHTSCAATLYPNLCLTSLESYANKIHCNTTELALVAMTINLDLALSTSGWLSNLMTWLSSKTGREHGAMKYCVENVETAVYNLKRSIEELVHPNGLNRGFVLGDLQTWVSAALTDEQTCLDGFAAMLHSLVETQEDHLVLPELQVLSQTRSCEGGNLQLNHLIISGGFTVCFHLFRSVGPLTLPIIAAIFAMIDAALVGRPGRLPTLFSGRSILVTGYGPWILTSIGDCAVSHQDLAINGAFDIEEEAVVSGMSGFSCTGNDASPWMDNSASAMSTSGLVLVTKVSHDDQGESFARFFQCRRLITLFELVRLSPTVLTSTGRSDVEDYFFFLKKFIIMTCTQYS